MQEHRASPGSSMHGQPISDDSTAPSPRSVSVCDPYEYEPLPPSKDPPDGNNALYVPSTLWTRLLTIHPGRFDDDIHVDLNPIRLVETDDSPRHDGRVRDYEPKFQAMDPQDSAVVRTYEALSYVWGSGADNNNNNNNNNKDAARRVGVVVVPVVVVPVVVFVGARRRTVSITRNLDEAIRHLRHPARPRTMWIDALCIDQQNEQERSRQVGYMCHIFWSTRCVVVVWLGPAADDSDHALETLRAIGARIRVNWATRAIGGVTDQDDAVWNLSRYDPDLPLSARDWAAVRAVVARPWFERIWIRQEVLKARGDNDDDDDDGGGGGGAVVCCGHAAAPWEPFRRALYRLTRSPVGNNALARNAIRGVTYSLAQLRGFTEGARCSDKRDHIYGLLGMIHEQKGLGIIPDYSKPVADVYRDVTLRHFHLFKRLRLLESCGNLEQEAGPSVLDGRSLPDLPSWVPDWSASPANYIYTDSAVPLTPLAACWDYLGNNVLRVAGVAKGIIRDVVELDTSTSRTFRASVRALVPAHAMEMPYPGEENAWDAYRIALCAGSFSDATEPAGSLTELTYRNSKTTMDNILCAQLDDLTTTTRPAPDGQAPQSPQDWFRITARALQYESRFFVTGKGLIGWAPKAARPGDHIVILLGCNAPMLLRPVVDPSSILRILDQLVVEQEQQLFQVVGPCYVQGSMHGQAFLGPLPHGMHPVEHMADAETGSRYHMEFHNPDTGETLLRDPRLLTTSLPLSSAEIEEWVQHGVSARVEPDVLRSHGFDIQHFDLV